jgi:hypothetical protein
MFGEKRKEKKRKKEVGFKGREGMGRDQYPFIY